MRENNSLFFLFSEEKTVKSDCLLCPDATFVAGRKTWENEFNRRVNRDNSEPAKDRNTRRALWKGECQRSSDKRYVYTYTDTYGKRRSVYAGDLAELRKKEQDLMKDQFDGIDSVKARNIATKYDLRPNTFHTYKYLYGHYAGDMLGKKKLADLRYADIVHFYFYLIEEKQLKVSILSCILYLR